MVFTWISRAPGATLAAAALTCSDGDPGAEVVHAAEKGRRQGVVGLVSAGLSPRQDIILKAFFN